MINELNAAVTELSERIKCLEDRLHVVLVPERAVNTAIGAGSEIAPPRDVSDMSPLMVDTRDVVDKVTSLTCRVGEIMERLNIPTS